MAILTLQEVVEREKIKRTQALMSKINILWARDGNEVLGIEAQKDVDLFNCQQLFGLSGNENIDWNHLGVEGLIRCYYHISYLLKGTTRKNVVRSNNYLLPAYCSTKNASLEDASIRILNGSQAISGFFSDNEEAARNGVFDFASSAFKSNREEPFENEGGKLDNQLEDLIELIGVKSPIGEDRPGSFSELVDQSILGFRNTDIHPKSIRSRIVVPEGGSSSYTEYYSVYGNGYWDNDGIYFEEFNFTTNKNLWKDEWTVKLQSILPIVEEVKTYINYSKTPDTSFFVNPNIIPGYTTNWSVQNTWLAQVEEIKTGINNFLNILSSYYPYQFEKTNPTGKTVIDNALIALRSQLQTSLNNINAIHTTINSGSSTSPDYGASWFGNPTDKGATLWGARAQWIKSILDFNDGSRVTLKGIATVLNSSNSSISKTEDNFILFGVLKQNVSWNNKLTWVGGIQTPEILEIEYHQTIDTREEEETYLELINDGYIISWTPVSHATSYDLWRSLDWDGTNGTWVKILSVGNQFSMQDINPNNGQVYNFYNDLSVNPDQVKPFYKVKIYDNGGEGDYSRIPAESVVSAPKNIDDFEGSGSGSNGVFYPASGGTGGGLSDEDPTGTVPKAGAISWREPVLSFSSLPAMGNRNCDVRLVVNEKALYYWSSGTSEWEPLLASGDNSGEISSWKAPVETISFLPTINNSDGDVRLVINENKLFRWDSELQLWDIIETSSQQSGVQTHEELSDMPDEFGINTDHDSRYYTENEVDTKILSITDQLDALKYLIPENAAPLSGMLKLIERTYSQGYLSHGYTGDQRFVTLQAEQYYDKIIKGGSLKLISQYPDKEFNFADKGSLILYINDVIADTFNLEINFNENERASQQSYCPKTGINGLIKVTEVGIYKSYARYQKGSFEITIGQANLAAGENSIKLVHSHDTVDETPELIIFYDPSTEAITFNAFDIRQNKLISNKYLSGIRYYSINDGLNFYFKSNKLYNNTYCMPNQISVDTTEFGVTPYSVNHLSTGSSFEDFGQPFINAILISDEAKTITKPNIISSLPAIKVKGWNLTESDEFVYTENILINTYSNKSTDTHEYFVDEKYRLPLGNYDSTPNKYTNEWYSNNLIGAADLQVFAGSLIYPKKDYTVNCSPSQIANYFGYTGDRVYIRAFCDMGTPHSNGVLFIKGYNLNTYINVEIKLPGQTDWMQLTKLYNEADFIGAASDGCLINHDLYHYQFTTGRFNTANSGYMILVKITMHPNNTIPIEELSINW